MKLCNCDGNGYEEMERGEKDGYGYWWVCPRCGNREWIREDEKEMDR